MIFLSPAELNLIARDHLAVLNGPDAAAVTLSWMEGGTLDEAYGTYVGEAAASSEARATIEIFKSEDIERRRWADVMAGDARFMFGPDQALEGKRNLKITVTGIGTWVVDFNPPQANGLYVGWVAPSGVRFAQWVYGRVER